MRYYDELHKHSPCPCGCGELADECGAGVLAVLGFAPAARSAACKDAARSNCSGPAKYAGRCGKHAAQARRR